MARLLHAAAAVAVCMGSSGTAGAQTYDCDGAQRSLTTKRQDVERTVRQYSACVGAGKLDTDCSGEFTRLRYAHADYERAVLDTKRYCAIR